MKSVSLAALMKLLTLSFSMLPAAVMATDFGKLEENCILSFVVPRDKVKSSCDVEERVTRRLNAMETKVTLYKQHVLELQEQLAKERQVHSQRLQELNLRMSQKPLGDLDGLLEARIISLENELHRIKASLSTSSSQRGLRASHLAGAANNADLGTGNGIVVDHSREEEVKATTNLVKTVVNSEVKKLFDNYTQYIGRYVRDQTQALNQIISMVPRNDQDFQNNNIPPKWPNSKSEEDVVEHGSTPDSVDSGLVLLNELEGIRSRLQSTSKKLADHMEKMFHNVTAQSVKSMPTGTSRNVQATVSPYASSMTGRNSELENSLLEANDTTSGDSKDPNSEHNFTLAFTRVPNDTANTKENQPNNLHAATEGNSAISNKDTSSAKSRLIYNTDLNKLSHITGTEDEEGSEPDVGVTNRSRLEENMVHDQSTAEWIQLLLRTELQKILQQQAEEVLSLVSKHSAMVDTKLQDHQLKFGQLEVRLAADIKQMDQVVSGLKLELSSVSQGLQNMYSRTELMEEAMLDLKKNMSAEGSSRILATLLDEQGKKIRKMERLTDIYKQSLEHYRNETKLEYRDLKERLEKESVVLKSLNTDLFHNITHHTNQLTEEIKTTTSHQVEEAKQKIQVIEDNSLLLQIDLSSLERQLKSKTSKSERDIDKLNQDVDDLKQKTRIIQKSLSTAEKIQEQLSQTANTTTVKMEQLQMEVKLNVLDEWLPYNFDYLKSRTDCFGEQFVKKSGFKTGRLVGVVLCTHNRYKIFLAQSLTDTFKNIGDDSGMGEDHCQFVDARSSTKVKVSPFRTSTETEHGGERTEAISTKIEKAYIHFT